MGRFESLVHRIARLCGEEYLVLKEVERYGFRVWINRGPDRLVDGYSEDDFETASEILVRTWFVDSEFDLSEAFRRALGNGSDLQSDSLSELELKLMLVGV